MSYNSELQSNNAELEEILQAVNELPEAGGGSADPVLQPLTVTPSEAEQEFIPNGFDGYSSVTAYAVSKTYVGSNVPRKSAEEIRPGTASREIASGTYLTGKQTILGDANLTAGNIREGVSIFNVLGTFAGSGGGSGGGGLPLGVSAIDYGTLTPTTDITSTTYIMHKLGVKPNFLCLIATGDFPFKERINEILLYTAWQKKVTESSGSEKSLSIQYTRAYTSGNPNSQYLSINDNVGSANRAYIECFTSSKLAAGITYLWLAGVIDELE